MPHTGTRVTVPGSGNGAAHQDHASRERAVEACAERELEEEAGLRLAMKLVVADPTWPVFLAEAPQDATVRLSNEHDAYQWVTLGDALDLIRPGAVACQFERAARTVDAPPDS